MTLKIYTMLVSFCFGVVNMKNRFSHLLRIEIVLI